jgi:DNA-binding transcriptional LysR family regulator
MADEAACCLAGALPLRHWARAQLREGTLVETLTDFEPEPRVVSALFARNRHEVPRVKVFIDFVSRLFQ